MRFAAPGLLFNGQLKIEKDYLESEIVTFRAWYENGQLKYDNPKSNLNGKPALHRAWYKNGQLLQETTVKDGRADGLLRIWDENGELTLEKCYKNNEEVDMDNCS